MEDVRSQGKIHALTEFEGALRTFTAEFVSEEAALNSLLANNESEQVASFLTLIRSQQNMDKDRKPPWDHFELEATKLILLSIFAHLEVPDLKILRLVCKQFCHVATPLLDAKTVLNGAGNPKIKKWSIGAEMSDIIPLAPTWIWNTHRFRHVELNMCESYLWVTPNTFKTFESLFLNPTMFNVETLRIHGFRMDLFCIELDTSIPACLARFWPNLKSIAFFDPIDHRDPVHNLHLSRHPLVLTTEDKMLQLEEIHFELDYKKSIDWSFLKMCPNLKVIKIDACMDEYTLRPSVVPPMRKCLELILPRLKRNKIEGLHFRFGVNDETDAIAEFVTAVAAKGSLKDVGYKIFTLKQDCLDFINSVPLPLNSAEFAISAASAQTSEDILQVLAALQSRGYFQLETLKFKCHLFSFEKQGLKLTITENAESTDANNSSSILLTSSLLSNWFPALQIDPVQDKAAVPMEVDVDDEEPESLSAKTTLEASSEFCKAIGQYVSSFGSTQEAVNHVLRMKESLWPNVTAFVYTCWASSLYDGEDWRMNPCVLEAICKRSSVESLKALRLVCKKWSKIASICLAKSSVTTYEWNKQKGIARRKRKRGLEIHGHPDNVHALLVPSHVWNIHLSRVEIKTCSIMWDNNLERLITTIFKNPATANLESLRLFNFDAKIVEQQILPYFIPKYLKKLKALTLLAPFSFMKEPPKFDHEPFESFMPLEKLVVQIPSSEWRPSWKFLNCCPKLKCFKLLEFDDFYPDPENFIKCLNEVWPFLKNKRIRKLGLKFSAKDDIPPIADFVTNIASLGSLEDVSFEIKATAVQVCQILQSFPLPSRRAKLVFVNKSGSLYGTNPPLASFVTPVLDQLASSGYITKLERLDFGVIDSVRDRDPLHRDVSLIVVNNTVAFCAKTAASFGTSFTIAEDYRERLSSWFPQINYVCCPYQYEEAGRPEVWTRIVELLVHEGSAFEMPGLAGRDRSSVIQGMYPHENTYSSLRSREVFDASVFHRHSVAVPSVFRSKDLHSPNCEMYIFSKVDADKFKEARDRNEEEGVEKKDISSWNIPENVEILVRTITTV